ncbi:MAG: hypothetical protein KY410_07145 [Proteobacteria bacterium]|nr:hypothetical protein [Pseudomonadota bacterium]
MPLLSMILLAIPMEPAALHAGDNAAARHAFTRAVESNAQFKEAADALQAMGD